MEKLYINQFSFASCDILAPIWINIGAGTSSRIKDISDSYHLWSKNCTTLFPQEHEKIKQLASHFVWFLFHDFLFPLIRFNFYVTDSSNQRNKLLFYRHDTWLRISRPAMQEYIRDNFTPTDMRPNLPKYRLVPKENGKFRPITSFLKPPSSVRNSYKPLPFYCLGGD